jgi:hypothetical protein
MHVVATNVPLGVNKIFYSTLLKTQNMKLLTALFLITSAAIVFTSCDGGGGASAAAKKLCDCSQPLVDMQKEMKEAGDDMDEMQKVMEKYEDEGTKMEECMKELDEKYKDKEGDAAWEEEVQNAMKDKCPEVYSLMTGGM